MLNLDDLKLGTILIVEESELSSPLPLEHTAVDVNILGAVASVEVSQRFGNPFDDPIELEYLFPLPHEAAIVDYAITIGKRVISAKIQERQAAQQTYQQAVEEGKRASLLEQRRPNIFSIQIANVQPGETISTRILLEDRLHYRDGTYEFVFPMGITPRYHDPAHISREEAKSVDSPIALDESKVAPVEINVNIDADVPISTPESNTHPIVINQQNEESAYTLNLAERTIPNKDFVLRYEASTDDLRAALWSSREDDDSADTLMMTILPPRLDIEREPQPREFIFVIDRSGSMGSVEGGPMGKARNALAACLRGLGENDTFAILAFDTVMDWFNSHKPLPINQKNVDKADKWINKLKARGGTDILTAISEAFAVKPDTERPRYVVFLTDGSVSADETAIRDINKKRGDARVFTFGIGPSVNRFLLNKMAQMGRGMAEFMTVSDDIETIITRFQDRVSFPALQNIKLKWENADSWDTYPDTLPDLYVGEPLEIVTRLKRKGEATLNIVGELGAEKVELFVDVPVATENNPTLKRVWARARIESLMDQRVNYSLEEKAREQIIALALEHRIATQFTSFVAVDSEVTESDGDLQKVKVATPLPDGLDLQSFIGGTMVGAGVFPARHWGTATFQAKAPAQTAIEYSRPKSSGVFRAVSGLLAGAVDAVSQLAGSGSDRDNQADIPRALHPVSPMPQEQQQPAPPPTQFRTIPERIKWLARTQNVNGSWDDDVERSAAALLAFVRAGHTTRAGNYRRQVHKAATWLSGQLDTNDFALFIAVKALDELHAASGDFEVPDEIRNALPDFQAPSDTSSAATLDDLRLIAYFDGDAAADAKLLNSGEKDLVETWLAVGKPAN